MEQDRYDWIGKLLHSFEGDLSLTTLDEDVQCVVYNMLRLNIESITGVHHDDFNSKLCNDEVMALLMIAKHRDPLIAQTPNSTEKEPPAEEM